MTRVRFAIGPVDAERARTWLDNSNGIVAGARQHRYELSIAIEEPLLDLVEAYLRFWRDAAEGVSVFRWDADVDPDHVRLLVEQWLALARLTENDLRTIGCTWAPPETQPFYDALLSAAVDALGQDAGTRPLARQLEIEPPGSTPDPDR